MSGITGLDNWGIGELEEDCSDKKILESETEMNVKVIQEKGSFLKILKKIIKG